MNKALVIGGSNGIGLTVAKVLQEAGNNVYVIDRDIPYSFVDGMHYEKVNLINTDFEFLNKYNDINILVITAGFGRVAPFESMLDAEINNIISVNTLSVTRILHHFFTKMKSSTPFLCAVMGSISGMLPSPLFATYAATKAAVCRLIESLNIELEMFGTSNRILNISPGAIEGTRFNGEKNNIGLITPLAEQIVLEMKAKHTIFIPQYENIYKNVLERAYTDAHAFGIESYKYKLNSNKTNYRPQLKVGYLSGTFDLFHIGHLNLLRKAKEYCDYLVVGVHKDASHKRKETFISFEERVEIVKNIRYVDRVIESEREDCDVYLKGIVRYDYLFVGSDYKGTERFNRYEQLFADKGVEIVYFPYTKSTSSSQLREALAKL